MNFGENLKKLRESCNLTQQLIADKLTITRQAYAKYEQNKREPNFDTLEKLTIILNCSYNDLLK